MVFLVWMKKYWSALVTGLVLILGVMFTVSVRKRPVIISGDDPQKKKIEDDVAKQEQQIQQQATEQKQDVTDQQQKDVQAVISAEQKKEPGLEKDPDATNDYLKQVGQETRGGGDGK